MRNTHKNKSNNELIFIFLFVNKILWILPMKSLLQAWASIRTITVHGDGNGPLLEATSARKVCSSNLSVRVAILTVISALNMHCPGHYSIWGSQLASEDRYFRTK